MTEFGKLDSEGNYEKLGDVEQADMRKCPHFIMRFEHYREDGTCRCTDPNHTEMAVWGYKWDNETHQWI